MKQLVAAVAVLIAVVAGISWATSRTSSAQEQDTPPEITVPEDEAPATPDEFEAAIDEFLSCLRDQGIEVPDVEQGEGRFGFHFDLDEEDFDALADAKDACGESLPLPLEGFEFGDKIPFGDGFPFSDEFPFGGKLGGGFLDLASVSAAHWTSTSWPSA